MPVSFLTVEQEQRYGRFNGAPTLEQHDRYFHLDDADLAMIGRRRWDHMRLGFAVQLGTVRFLGAFLADPTEVPAEVAATLAQRIGIADPRCLERYLDRKARWQHASGIRQAYGYREFADPGAQWRLLRWLYALCWTGTDRPSVLFNQATAWLVTHKVLLPGASVLERTIARVRSRANSRLWRLLAARIKPDQKARLDTVLVVPEGGRQSPMDRLRSGPTLQSTAELARLDDVRQLAAGLPRTDRLPKTRVLALARFADAAKAQAVARLPDERRGATLLAFIRALEASAQDDVLDLFDLLVTRMFVDAVRKGREARLRSLRDLDAAALTLSKACALVLNVAVNDGDLRAVVFAVVPQTALEAAVAQVDSLTRPPDDPYFDELLAQHRRIRRFLPRLVRTVGFGAMPAGQPVLKALQHLRKVEEGGVRGKTWPTEFVPKSWERRVIRNGIVDRHAWTLCLVDRLRGALRRRDVFAAPSLRFGDPRIGLLDGAAWEAARPTVCRTLAKSQNAAEEIGRLSNRLDHAFRSVAGNLPKNASVRIEQNGIDLARRWGGGDVASADGLRFIVPVRTIHAGPNPKYFGPERGVTYYNLVCDQFTGLNAITVPGTLRDSLVLLSVVLEQETEFEPTEIMTDTGAYTDVILGIFWLLGYQFSPRIADVGGARFWRVDSTADYGALDKLASHKVKTRIVAEHWDDLLRLAGSLKLGLVQVGGLMRTLQTNERPTRLARALEELGRIIKTLYLLAYIDNEAYRRRILNQLNRGEGRHQLARVVFHGKRGELRQRYREGQEDQLGALGLVVNAIILWNTIYMDAALDQLRAEGFDVRDEDVARLSPLGHEHINMLGRYAFTLPEPVARGELRPLRSPAALSDDA